MAAIDAARRGQRIRSPRARHKPNGRGDGDLARAPAIKLAQHHDGLQQLLAVGAGAQLKGGERSRGEGTHGAVVIGELGEVAVAIWAGDLAGELERQLQLLGGSALPDLVSDVLSAISGSSSTSSS